ncbi:alpha/beta hydrolase [Amycolatopsis sp. AA4]|uniref:alpha/beta fold hydrolase n=1 Tax=Actinomycetes TaxID=1760 RepID=UPI0001B5707A|nr:MULTISPECIES: alpha/beta hydrolase [Actinomycetes]ATY12790.1 alpha/beta hydrolase [Amycolatopsis sp. AA4]EFL08610.1 predicted protein [Streptomyces sp. AA4]
MNSLTAIKFGLNAAAAVSPSLAGKLAFPLFVRTGARAKVRPPEQAVHDAADAERMRVDGKELAVYRWGDSDRRVLLMHGFDSRASSWAALVPGILELGMSAVAFDSFGHGDSEGDRSTIVDTASAARAVAAKYGPFRAVVAHSFGGLCAYHALRTGVPADRLVTIGAVCDFGYLPVLFTGRLGLGGKVADDLRRRSEQYFAPEEDIWNRFSATYRADEAKWPLLVIHDDKDKEIHVSQGRKIAETYPRAEFLETSGLGHRRILGDGEVVARTLEFIARGETG